MNNAEYPLPAWPECKVLVPIGTLIANSVGDIF